MRILLLGGEYNALFLSVYFLLLLCSARLSVPGYDSFYFCFQRSTRHLSNRLQDAGTISVNCRCECEYSEVVVRP
ncbi:hypothetical protein BDV95DRAFT_55282 [Massariosphaeria phaeospora]|uniref:Uncharacterized protein n=1 Tax=Massariosphaeria phaeospora TaxID=100035 RepID=A0A7C8M7Z1_9PLEO|nr:hypothetical protein BDV95DRAFT_55282 [Massariosphaeria phaeospora]